MKFVKITAQVYLFICPLSSGTAFEKNGYIHRSDETERAIEIVDDTFNLSCRELVNVPPLSVLAAGAPILADENVENYFPIPAELLPNSETFMLKVRGNSMIDVGI